MPKFVDLTNEIFGDWKVLSRAGKDNNGHILWNCINSKGETAVKSGYALKGMTKSTSSNNKCIDLTGQTFGEWTVIRKSDTIGNQGAEWVCRCSCGKEAIVPGKKLRSGYSKSCGHSRGMSQFIDLTNQVFGDLTAIEYLGNHKWKCKCSCGNETVVHSHSLRIGEIRSCGCKRTENRIKTLLSRYGDTNTEKIDTPREDWQIKAVESADNLRLFIINYIDYIGEKPTRKELSDLLGINVSWVGRLIREYKLTDIVRDVLGTSYTEKDITDYIRSLIEGTGYSIETKNRDILNGEEVDIYIPELKIGIEYNGSYWHSELFKDKKYHYNKSKLAAEKGIRLVHIFDYEYLDNEKAIKNYISDLILNNKTIINARNCDVVNITNTKASEFLNKYHLQGFVASEIYLGLQYNNEIVAVMTFGKPRFSGEEYELLRLSVKYNTIINGGIDKIFKYFINTYNPKSIVSYCDISKFLGSVYTRLGFTNNGTSEPNYKWVNTSTMEVLSRYQTQKTKLLEKGFGTVEQSEADIMHNIGYYRVYDCGNIKYVWTKE